MSKYDELEDDNLILHLVYQDKDSYYYKGFDKKLNYVGNFGIRLSQDKDNYYFGNIEYEVYDKYRGNNFGEKATRLLYKIAEDNNLKDLLISTDPTNFASIKTIYNLGGKLIENAKVPENHELYKQDEKVVAIFKVKIPEGVKK